MVSNGGEHFRQQSICRNSSFIWLKRYRNTSTWGNTHRSSTFLRSLCISFLLLTKCKIREEKMKTESVGSKIFLILLLRKMRSSLRDFSTSFWIGLRLCVRDHSQNSMNIGLWDHVILTYIPHPFATDCWETYSNKFVYVFDHLSDNPDDYVCDLCN